MNDGVGSGYAHNKLRDLVFQSNEDHNNQFDYDEFERILKAEYHSGIKWNPNGSQSSCASFTF